MPRLNRARNNQSLRRAGRGGMPSVLLTDVVTVEAYRDVNTWGLPYQLKCLVDEAPQTMLTENGTVFGRAVTIYAPLGSDVPEGSRITLADGRLGAAAAVAERGPTTVFPVPSHLEIRVSFGKAAPTPIGARTVIIVRRAVVNQDVYGNDIYSEKLIEVQGVAVGQIDSTDATQPGNQRVRRTRLVVFPPGTTITAEDRLIIDDQRWGIDGEPTLVEQPVLGLTAGVVVRAVRTTG